MNNKSMLCKQFVTAMFLLLLAAVAQAADVLTYHNDAFNDGQNLSETTLTPGNVNSSSFGKLFSVPVDGQVYAQVLYRAGVN
ncbi:MAG: hypothetical protein PHD76_13865, partial [Methylacidiphilales bacterium]|nr:hypothetical protein [Candidatus Methylacidiphilales bacterium]